MGGNVSRERDYAKRLEYEAVRAAVPRGLLDDKGMQLRDELHWCLAKNDWYFTGGVCVCLCACVCVCPDSPASSVVSNSLHILICTLSRATAGRLPKLGHPGE